MKKTLILLTAILLPALSHAQTGCWVDFATNQCDPYAVDCYYDPDDLTGAADINKVAFGFNIASLCLARDTQASIRAACEANLVTCDAGFSALNGAYNTTYSRLTSANSLIKKLKKACGAKCKKIK